MKRMLKLWVASIGLVMLFEMVSALILVWW
jgi:hypothetical protein